MATYMVQVFLLVVVEEALGGVDGRRGPRLVARVRGNQGRARGAVFAAEVHGWVGLVGHARARRQCGRGGLVGRECAAAGRRRPEQMNVYYQPRPALRPPALKIKWTRAPECLFLDQVGALLLKATLQVRSRRSRHAPGAFRAWRANMNKRASCMWMIQYSYS